MVHNAVRIVQITDLHLFSNSKDELLGVNTYQSFHAVLDLVKKDKALPDLFLLTGDLSQDHQKEAYVQIAEAFKSFTVPVYFIPGNHDDCALMENVFHSAGFPKLKQILLDQWQLILLNSQKPHVVQGYLSRSQLDFLEDCLKRHPSHRSIITFHHHPLSVGSPWLDGLGLENSDELWNLLARYPNTHTVFFGHVHQEFQGEKNGIACYAAPSTCIQFKTNSVDFALEKIAPGYRWIDLYPSGDLKTGICRLENYVGNFDAASKGY